MSIGSLEWLLHLMLFSAVTYLAYVFLSEFGSARDEILEQQTQSGGAGLTELYIGLSPEVFFLLRVCSAGAIFFITLPVLGVIFAAALAAGGYMIPQIMLARIKRKRVGKVEAQLVEGLELLGNSLKSGLTLQQAVELLVREFPPPISQEFSLVLAEVRLGVEFSEALERMAERLNSNVVHILSSGVAIVKQCGGDITQIFTNIATTIREQATIEGKLNAVTAQGRFQGLILGLMPFALLVVLYFIDPSHVETLFSYQLGIWAFAAVIIMVILAQLWIRKLLDIDV